MSNNIQDNLYVYGQKPIDAKFFKNGITPYSSVTDVNSSISLLNRYPGLMVYVKIGTEHFIYIYKNGITDGHLELLATGGGSGEGTLPAVMIFKDTVDTYDDLPSTGQEQGWVYGVIDTGKLYVWVEDYTPGNSIWKDMGVSIDFSDYPTFDDLSTALADYVTTNHLSTYYYSKTQANNTFIPKQGINLGDTGNILEMKTGDISGIYRGNPASNPVYDFSPFIQMTTDDTFAQLHFRYDNGEMSYRAGNAEFGYSTLRTSWDNVNLPSPATQTWVNQYFLVADTAIVAGFVNGNKEIPYIRHSDMTIVGLATTNWVTTQTTPATQAEVEASTGTESKPTFYEPETEDRKFLTLFNFFKLIKKLRYIHLLPNSGTAVANRLWSDGTDVYYDDNLAVSNKLAKDRQIYKIISANTTLDNTYHNAIVRIEANATINVPTNLRNDFNCVFEAIGSVVGTFAATSPATISAPFGLILRDSAMATLYKYATNSYRLNGGTLPV